MSTRERERERERGMEKKEQMYHVSLDKQKKEHILHTTNVLLEGT
jgi:hypothetical protein